MHMYDIHSTAPIIIDRNQFEGGTLFIRVYQFQLLNITGNIFKSSNTDALSIELEYGFFDSPGMHDNDAFQMTNNLFTNNHGTNALLLSCYYYRTTYQPTMRISENSFVNNQVSYVIHSECYGLCPVRNIFLNPESIYDLFNEIQLTGITNYNAYSGGPYAIGNYWNATSFSNVSSRIYDGLDDTSLMAVKVSPWYTDAALTSLTSEDSFIRSNGYQIGGTLTGDVVLRYQSQPYEVFDDIVVPYGMTLQIEPGVQVKVIQAGITVRGKIDIV